MRFYVPKVLYSEGSIFRNMRFYVPKVLYSEGPIFKRFYIPKVLYSEGSMFRNFGFCSLSSSDAVVDDMDEIERVWVGVGVKIKKVGKCRDNCTWRLKYYK